MDDEDKEPVVRLRIKFCFADLAIRLYFVLLKIGQCFGPLYIDEPAFTNLMLIKLTPSMILKKIKAFIGKIIKEGEGCF